MKKAIPTLLGLVVLAAIGFGVSRLLGGPGPEAEPERAPRPLPVETAPLTIQPSLLMERRFTGTLVARRTAELSFEGSGRIAEILVDDGDSVAKGQPLAMLDTAVLAAKRAEVASRRTRLDAQLAELLAGPRQEAIDAARADVQALQEQRSLGVVLRDRREALVQNGTISSEQLDTARTEVATVEARLSAAKARLSELENGTRKETVAAQRGAIGEVDAALLAIDVAIKNATLIAPFAGRIASRMVDEGVIVSQQMPRAAFTLVESSALEARVGVPPDLADSVVSGEVETTLTVRGHPVPVLTRTALPTVNAATRTVTVLFRIDPQGAKDRSLRPGDIVTTSTLLSQPIQGAWVPMSALSESTRGLWSLYQVVDRGDAGTVAQRMEVEVLHVKDGRAYVRGSLGPDATIVVSGAHRLVPGQTVDPVAAPPVSPAEAE